MQSASVKYPANAIALLALAGILGGCRAPASRIQSADRVAHAAIAQTQQSALGHSEPLTVIAASDTFRRRLIETQALPVAAALSADPAQLPAIPHWDPSWRRLSEMAAPLAADSETPVLTMMDALRLAAHGNHDYQARKEALFLTALALDLEDEAFRHTLAGMLGGRAENSQGGDETVTAIGAESAVSVTRVVRTGAKIAAALTFDLVKLLTQSQASAFGLRLDTSISIPLGRGAGRHIVMESLTQAQRDLVAAVREFEHYKAEFAVDIAGRYFNVLAAEDQVRNAAENLQRLETNARRARRMAEAGRLPEIQVDQAVQEGLRAASRSIAAIRRHADILDQFKVSLGLPPDARLQLDRAELETLVALMANRIPTPTTLAVPAETAMAAYEPLLPEDAAIIRALENRLDLQVVLARVEDAQRKVIIAADALGIEAALTGEAAFGERRSPGAADQGDARLRFDEGRYGAVLRLDAPWRRVAERNALRRGLVQLEQAIRKLQELEDRIKLQIRGDLRGLAQAHENLIIQADAMRIAERRVRGSDLFLEAGRAAIRDVLEAQDALLSAQNAFTDAVVAYRLGELGFQRNLGLLRVDGQGLWTEWIE